MSIQRNMMKTYGAGQEVAANLVKTGINTAATIATGGAAAAGKAAMTAAKGVLFGSSSIEFDKMIGEQAMQRVQAQTEAKIPKSIDPDGGKDGSETT